MHQFADRVGWKMQKKDEELVLEFCNEVGVEKGVLKVWMHNNKNTFARRDVTGAGRNNNILEHTHNNDNGNGNDNSNNDNNNETNNHGENPNNYQSDSGAHGATNGSSSSS